MNDLLADLTPAQREAVTHMNGPMLVVAGAGSGKTRVVTRRVAWLVARGVKPWRILALTFTNKAAREMRERVEALVGEAPRWMGTFHSICARMLRMDIGLLQDGRTGAFTILDQGDQEGLVKQAMKARDIDPKAYKPSSLLAAISKAKGDFIAPEAMDAVTPRDRAVQEAYALYEQALRANNALDFDDLLILGAKLLQTSPEALMKYRNRFPYILVDEYQDTNRAQYSLLKALAGTAANIHATGDPDQSIYSWRGADYRNIMDFQRDFPGAKIVRLEENYRSTQRILDAANHLIRHNAHRIAKDLFTNRGEGEKIAAVRLQSDRMEASWIADRLAELRDGTGEAGEGGGGGALGEMAVFYRTNAQSRALEEALMARGIPYQLVGGVRFYERKEVKDLLAHLKARVNPMDLVSLRRIVQNRPGIGGRSLEKVAEAAEAAGAPVFSFLADPHFPGLYGANKKMLGFAAWCARLAAVDTSRADVAVREILALSGLVEAAIAAADKDDLSEDRIENLHAMTGRAGEFVAQRLASGGEREEEDGEEIRASGAIDLAAFLEDVALVADIDGYSGAADKATLMTLHSAKGLEFDNVFVTGLEEGLLPHRNCRDDAALEEERRLFYVGITRAKRRAWVTHAATRFIHGSVDFSKPSRFLEELPPSAVAERDYGDSLSLQFGGGYGSGPAGGSAGGKKAWEDFDPFEAEDFADGTAQPDAFDDMGADPVFADEDGFIEPDAAARPKRAWPKAKTPARPPKQSKFRPGDLVRHPLFGSGKVLTAERGKIMIQFFSSGTRLLNEDLAQLSKE